MSIYINNYILIDRLSCDPGSKEEIEYLTTMTRTNGKLICVYTYGHKLIYYWDVRKESEPERPGNPEKISFLRSILLKIGKQVKFLTLVKTIN